MNNQLNCIMLIDDNKIDNFFHERVIRKNNAAKNVVIKESGEEALEYLDSDENEVPDLIFLDINMPGMSGWEFIEHYKELKKTRPTACVVVMLSTSDLPDDKALAEKTDVITGFHSKPLTKEMLEEAMLKC